MKKNIHLKMVRLQCFCTHYQSHNPRAASLFCSEDPIHCQDIELNLATLADWVMLK